MVAGAALLAVKTSGEAIDEDGLIDLELDHMVEPQIALGQHFVERLRLGKGSRETVENKAGAAIRLADAVGDHANDDVVRNELPGIHDALDTQPEFATRKGRGPQHVSSG